MLPVAVAWSSSDDCATGYVLPVLWMTSCELFTVSRQVALGVKSATDDCLVLLTPTGESHAPTGFMTDSIYSPQ